MRSFRAILIGGLAALALISTAEAQEAPVPPKQDWSFYGALGTFDRAAAQRGFQIYREVCSACHSMNLLSYRNLADLGYDEAQVKAIAASVTVQDGPNDQGEMFDRPGRPSDHFKPPYPNEQAARAVNNGALPPDLSLIIKAREYGPDYVYGILTGFKDTPPPGITVAKGMYYNEYFPGHQIAMPPPLTDDRVTYADGTKATLQQEAHDVATFLTWASEPKLEERHKVGARVMIFLVVLSGIMYGVKRKIWSKVEH
jgi:ubiquinol-cytochrome c reductase cytochrome c1 subunit